MSDDPILVTSPSLICVGTEGNGVLYWDTASGRQVAVGTGVARVLEWFRTPATVQQWQSAGEGGFDHGDMSGELDRLGELGLLVEHGSDLGPGDGPLERNPSRGTGLFDCRRLPLAQVVRNDAFQAVVVGMPYDVGTSGRPGTRFGPSHLRGASRVLFRRRDPDDIAGMYDPVRQKRVLAGVKLADVGDIVADVHTRNGESMDVLQRVTGAVAAAGQVPVVLGGDHSITLPAVRGVLATHSHVGIIHFDAHADFHRPRNGDWRTECHHGNFLDWLAGDSRVTRLVQLGIRQLVDHEAEACDKRIVWPGTTAAADPQLVLETTPDDVPYYVTIDVDCLDPTVMPSTGTPLPGGFSHAQLVNLLEELCGARKVVGMDVVEYLPDGDALAGHVAADLLLRAMDSALHPRATR